MTNQTDPAALVKAALERAAVDMHDHAFTNAQWERAGEDVRSAFALYFLALADDPEAVAEIIERARGETDGG